MSNNEQIMTNGFNSFVPLLYLYLSYLFVLRLKFDEKDRLIHQP